MKSTKVSGTDSVAPLLPPSREQIAALAHALWIDRGRREGGDLEHWFEAERQLRGERPLSGPEPRGDHTLR